MVKKNPNFVNIVCERPLRVSMVMTIHNNLLNNTMKAYTNVCIPHQYFHANYFVVALDKVYDIWDSIQQPSQLTIGHLFCTLISENQGLEKLRSVSNLKKKSGPAHLIFFQ